MKRAFYIMVVLSISVNVSAQTSLFDLNTGPFTNALAGKAGYNGQWWIAGYYGACGGAYLILRLDHNGNSLPLGYVDSVGVLYYSDIDTFMGNTFLIGQNQPVYEKTGGIGGAVQITRYDSMGNIIGGNSFLGLGGSGSLDHPLHDSIYSYDQFFKVDPYHISVKDTNHLYTSVQNFLSLVNPSNSYSVYWTQEVSGYINSLLYCNNYVYLATDSGVVETDTNGNFLRQIKTTGWALKAFKTSTGKLYFTDQQSIFETDTVLNVLASYNLSDSLSSWVGLTGNDTMLILAGQRISNSAYVLVTLDTGLTQLTFLASDSNCSRPECIATDSDNILLVKQYSFYGHPVLEHTSSTPSYGLIVGSFSIYDSSLEYMTYDYNGQSNSPQVNALIMSATMESSVIPYFQQFAPPIADFYMKVALQNTGNDTIHNINLVSNLLDAAEMADADGYPIPGCTYNEGTGSANNLSVVPGDTFSVTMSFEIYVDSPANPSIYVSSINGSPIAEGCDTNGYYVPQSILITGINTPVMSKFKISPNPTDGIFNIQADVTNDVIFSLYDLSGKLLLEQNLVNENTQLNIKQLASGMYIYCVKSGTQIPFTGKLVKE